MGSSLIEYVRTFQFQKLLSFFSRSQKLAEISTGLGEAMVGIDFDPSTLKGAKEYQ